MNKVEQYINRILNESTVEKPIWNREKLSSGKPNKWNYVDGCMMSSLQQLYEVTNDQRYFDYLKQYIDYYLEELKPKGYKYEAFNLDNINEGKVLHFLYDKTSKESYKETIDLLYKQIKNQPRTSQGNFWHKQIYPNQVWLDGLYMVMPFYMEYETKYNKLAEYKDIFTQIQNIRKYMFDPKSKLYFHGYDASKSIFWADPKTGLSKNHWLRSIGWFAAALVDTLEVMDEFMYFEYRAIQDQYRELIDGLLEYKVKNGIWNQVVDSTEKENYQEVSGSAMISYSILKATRLGYLPKRYEKIGLDIYNTIENEYLIEEDGKIILKNICLVSGLGPKENPRRDGTVGYYLSEPIVSDDGKGIAPFIMSYCEVLRLKK